MKERVYTTFRMDFDIADRFGMVAIRDTYRRAFKEWRSNAQYLAELVIVLNHKIWEHYEKNDAYARLYDELWKKSGAWALDNLKGDDLAYYCQITD